MRFLAFLLGLVAVYACELKGEDDYYEILDVERDADEKAIKKSYKKLSLLCHPDRPGGDAEKFAMVGEGRARCIPPGQRLGTRMRTLARTRRTGGTRFPCVRGRAIATLRVTCRLQHAVSGRRADLISLFLRPLQPMAS